MYVSVIPSATIALYVFFFYHTQGIITHYLMYVESNGTLQWDVHHSLNFIYTFFFLIESH